MENYQVQQPQIYPQQAQQQPVAQQNYVQQPITNAAPAQTAGPSASGVNIIIHNPTANPAPNYLPTAYPSNYYLQQPVYNMYPNNGYPQAQPATQATAPVAAAPVSEPEPQAAAPVSKDDASKTEEKKNGKTKNVVQLTDEYIKTLENYLRNPNKEIRMMGAKELSKRFTEDDSRKGDKALNALLNLVLQDKSSDVRFLGLAIVNGGLAQGDSTTINILQNMQNSQTSYGQDALTATEALLKMSGNTIKVPDNSPDKPEKSEKKAE